ncbi:MAG: SdrD B-like domain-containing protein [Acidobacteriota bacterium]
MKRLYLFATVMMLCLLVLPELSHAQSDNPLIRGRVWLDTNQDGLQTGNEPGYADVLVELYKASDNSYVTSTNTIGGVPGQRGRYEFTNLELGTYYVKFIPPDGYRLTVQGAGNGNNDSDPDPGTLRTGDIVIDKANASVEHIDAGLIPKDNDGGDGDNEEYQGSIGNFVWCDENGNGIFNIYETGIPGMAVELYKYEDSDWWLIKETVTDRYGMYTFYHLAPGVYKVHFIALGNDKFTIKDAGENDAKDSDANPDGWTDPFTLEPNENNRDIDAGLLCNPMRSCIGNFVWRDCNHNGIQDPGEPGIPDVTVQLFKWGSTDVFRTTKTNSLGIYTFCDLEPGDYYVKFILPNCYVFTKMDQGGSDVLDSDADPVTGKTGKITLTSSNNYNIDAGMYPINGLSKGMASGAETPTEFALGQNYPNPFNPSTTIEFAVPTAGQYTLKVFNTLGQEVATLLDQDLPVGYHMVVFDASKLPSGMYIYRLSGSNVMMVKKMMLSK